MKYKSTRGKAESLGFEEVLLAGLARDGGLYLPESWPQLSKDDIRAMRFAPFTDTAIKIMTPFLGQSGLKDFDFENLVKDAYDPARFAHKAVAPLRQLENNLFVLELFHGPTLAFKDFAMQVLARLMDKALKRKGQRATIIGATSGDTGGAAIEAFAGLDNIDIFILHPEGRVSEVQRRQMTTAPDQNVHNIALKGTFDDCQAIVKQLFNDHDFKDKHHITGVNSINWARIMAQITYYFTAASSLGAPDVPVSFSVPTGNFGDIFAGFAAKQMGLPIDNLVIATNKNDILVRCFETGDYAPKGVFPTMSPSMDIQVSSNFERLLFELSGRDASVITGLMDDFAQKGQFSLPKDILKKLQADFIGGRVSEEETLSEIGDLYSQTGILSDPHSAIGILAGRRHKTDGVPMVCLATAHPAKFPDSVKKAAGQLSLKPDHLIAQETMKERLHVLDNSRELVANFIADHRRCDNA